MPSIELRLGDRKLGRASVPFNIEATYLLHSINIRRERAITIDNVSDDPSTDIFPTSSQTRNSFVNRNLINPLETPLWVIHLEFAEYLILTCASLSAIGNAGRQAGLPSLAGAVVIGPGSGRAHRRL
jgi:hypothetical protein